MPDHLKKFKTAQQNCYLQAKQEIKNGKKQTHWMWFIFPQIAGLGKSAMAEKYAIKNLQEAKEYLLDDTLSQRLLELTSILAYEIKDAIAAEIFGSPDFLKWHSCLTLFDVLVNTDEGFKKDKKCQCFYDSLEKYYQGKKDHLTLEILERQDPTNNLMKK